MNLKIQELVHVLQAQLILGDPRTLVKKASVDSRLVEAGDIYFALRGDRVDGHDFVMSAVKSKAVAVVVSQLGWMKSADHFGAAVLKVADPLLALKMMATHLRQQYKGPVVGITGSNGKTTTKQMLAHILSLGSQGLSTSGNYNSQIGLPLMISELSTEHQWLVLEMGASELGNISTLADMAQPNVSVITSIGPAHLKTFGSLQNVARTKWEIIEALPHNGLGVVPWGEPLLQSMIRSSKKKLIFFGDDSSCPVRASSIEMAEKIKFMLHVGSNSLPVTLPVLGRFNVNNALAAAGAAWALNIPLEQIAEGLSNFEPAPMRMQIHRHSSGAIIINDAYNANPSSLINSIRSVMETYPDRKRVVVIGAMRELGDESATLHFHAGAELGRFGIDQVFVMGPDTEKIIEGAQAAGAPTGRFVQEENPTALVNKLMAHLNGESLILFKGSRSMHLENIVEALIS